jgi:hypothetical protein
MDPTRDLVIVVLANRVHPTRANAKWGEMSVRGGVADRVVRGLEQPAPQSLEHDRRFGNAVGFALVGGVLGATVGTDSDGDSGPHYLLGAVFAVMGALGGWLGSGL